MPARMMSERRVRALLVGSLLLNLFAVGVIGGGVARLEHPGLWRAHAMVARPLREAGDALPPPDRVRFRQAMRATVRSSADLTRTAREGRREAARLFTAPTFDAVAVEAALARARAADLELRARLETTAIDFASGLPPDERLRLAEGLAHGGPLRGFRRLAAPNAR